MYFAIEDERRRLKAERAARLSMIAEYDQVLARIFKYPYEFIDWPKKLSLLLEKNDRFNIKIYAMLVIVSSIMWSLSIANILYETTFDYTLNQSQARADADRDFMVGNNTYCEQIPCALAPFYNGTTVIMVLQSLCIFPLFLLVLLGFNKVHYSGKGFYCSLMSIYNYKDALSQTDITPYHLRNVAPSVVLLSLNIIAFSLVSRDCVPADTIQDGYDWAYQQQFGWLCKSDASLPQCSIGSDKLIIIPPDPSTVINLMATAMGASSRTVHLALLTLLAVLMVLFSLMLKKPTPLQALFLEKRIYNHFPYSVFSDAFSQPHPNEALVILQRANVFAHISTDLRVQEAVKQEFLGTHTYVRRREALLAWWYGIPESIEPSAREITAVDIAPSSRYEGIAVAGASQPLLG
jgi:hypothetical protein